MLSLERIFLGHLLLMSILCLEAVKIGISKPLPVTTTLAPNANTSDSTTEEISIETTVMTTAATATNKSINTTTTTTTKPTSNEVEWPEFPPKKSSNKTTTKKPTTTTPKTSTTTTTSTTTVLPEVQNTTATPTMTTSSISHVHFPNKYCFCDLNPLKCDINCCCDLDCPPDVFKVFHCLPEQPIDLEVQEGRFEDFKFQHGLPSCQTNDGWLCVFRTYKPIVQEQIFQHHLNQHHAIYENQFITSNQ
ncbi:hypothetical protein DOY81_006991 [Sarcophaga bullata]|nr:hypothetical protein DOY81_006991 [Sarcophaga bullata]